MPPALPAKNVINRGRMPVSVERVVTMASDSRQVWCAIGDTERMNRAVGLGPLAVTPHQDASAARYVVRTVSGGFALEYEEQPFVFTEHEHFRVHRAMRRGVLRSMTNEFWLTPAPDGGTSVRFRLSVEPRWSILSPILKLQLHRFANRPYTVFGREYVPGTTLRPYRERGVASWYGRKFHGQKTATGEAYDMYGTTAAHPVAAPVVNTPPPQAWRPAPVSRPAPAAPPAAAPAAASAPASAPARPASSATPQPATKPAETGRTFRRDL